MAPSGARSLAPLFPIDLTEVPGLDDWAAPDGIIGEAEALAARTYGVKTARLITTGSSTALTIAIAASLGEGDMLLAHRGVHRSILHGLLVARARLTLIADAWSEPFGVSWPDVTAMIEAVHRLRPKAVVVTSPTFTGLAPDITPLVDAAHEEGALVIVDAAHGAHFGHPGMPPLASSTAADLIVFGMHKSGGALTAGSLLGIGQRADTGRVQLFCRALSTSSPAYPVMASIDLAVRSWANGEAPRLLATSIGTMSGLRGEGVFKAPPDVPRDPSRVVMAPLAEATFARHGIVPEYISEGHALLLAPLGLPALPRPFLDEVRKAGPGPDLPAPPQPEVTVHPWQATFAGEPPVWTPLTGAVGRVSADLLSPSPPGIPWVWPGEVIGNDIVERLLSVRRPQRVLGMNARGEVLVAR